MSTFSKCLFLIGAAALFVLSTAVTSVAHMAVEGRFLVVYRDGQIPADAASEIAMKGARLTERHELLGVAVVEGMSTASRTQIAANAEVEYVVADALIDAQSLTVAAGGLVPAQGAAADALYHSAQGWAVKQVGGFGAEGKEKANGVKGPWDATQGAGVRIAILDSGVDPNHADIAPNLVMNLSEVSTKTLPSMCDDGSAVDQQGHGTWTASLVAGALGAGTGLVAGVAPQASILNIKVVQRMPGKTTASDPTGCEHGQASGLVSWLVQGIEDAMMQRADVISMSLGALVDVTTNQGAGEREIFNRATKAASDAGIVLIAAAGNDGYRAFGDRYVELPAQSSGVLAIVASTNPACAENLKAGATCVAGPVSLPYYSNDGGTLNALAAPGGSYPGIGADTVDTASMTVNSGWITGACSSGKASTVSGVPSDSGHSLGCFDLGHAGYVQAMGTSASAPLVAGAAALVRAGHPDWNAAQVVAALRTSATVSGKLTTPQVSVAPLLTPVQ